MKIGSMDKIRAVRMYHVANGVEYENIHINPSDYARLVRQTRVTQEAFSHVIECLPEVAEYASTAEELREWGEDLMASPRPQPHRKAEMELYHQAEAEYAAYIRENFEEAKLVFIDPQAEGLTAQEAEYWPTLRFVPYVRA